MKRITATLAIAVLIAGMAAYKASLLEADGTLYTSVTIFVDLWDLPKSQNFTGGAYVYKIDGGQPQDPVSAKINGTTTTAGTIDAKLSPTIKLSYGCHKFDISASGKIGGDDYKGGVVDYGICFFDTTASPDILIDMKKVDPLPPGS